MDQYIGTKLVSAKPMNRQEYNDYRGWDLPKDENGEDLGYLVEYLDGGKPNHPNHQGYISWSPKRQFDNAHRKTNGMPFGLALEAVKKGKRIQRTGWNGKNQFVFLITGRSLQNAVGYGFGEYAGEPTITSALAIKTSSNQVQVGWLASQSDMLSDDWVIV